MAAVARSVLGTAPHPATLERSQRSPPLVGTAHSASSVLISDEMSTGLRFPGHDHIRYAILTARRAGTVGVARRGLR